MANPNGEPMWRCQLKNYLVIDIIARKKSGIGGRLVHQALHRIAFVRRSGGYQVHHTFAPKRFQRTTPPRNNTVNRCE